VTGLGCRKNQLVVVAAGEHAVALEFGVGKAREHRGSRNPVVVDQCTHRGSLEDMCEVARESVGHIDGRCSQPSQPFAKRDARLGLVQTADHRFGDCSIQVDAPEVMHEAEGGAPHFA
jgi:hypothetical protein